jgi:hypothetical protein
LLTASANKTRLGGGNGDSWFPCDNSGSLFAGQRTWWLMFHLFPGQLCGCFVSIPGIAIVELPDLVVPLFGWSPLSSTPVNIIFGPLRLGARKVPSSVLEVKVDGDIRQINALCRDKQQDSQLLGVQLDGNIGIAVGLNIGRDRET